MTWLLLPVGLVLYGLVLFAVVGICGHNTRVEQAEQRAFAEDVDSFLHTIPGVAVNAAAVYRQSPLA